MMKRLMGLGLAVWMLLAGALALAEMPTEDRAGNPIALPETVETVVSLSPSTTEVIVDLGMADKLVGVDTYSADVAGIPEGIALFDMMTPDMERMVELSPDAVLVTGMVLVEGGDPFERLADMGICIAYIPSSTSIEGILEDNLFIGRAVGNETGARALNATLTDAIDALRVETDAPVPVYFEIGSMPQLYSFGSGTFLDEMIGLLGGRNIFADQQGWVSVSEEAVIAADPQVIFTNESWNPDAVQAVLDRPGWADVDAVRNGRVYLIDANLSSRPNHRIVGALQAMAEAFGE
ncbi:ABC transporter substrate-binding protein [Eubacteriales bacterium OttesenSCG-928-A19]|nr:ABC transporter substrate-binding protein [Eubacteriales bacterium OttesenSCG-928-A19]